jgi:hypothetical protein
MPMRHGAGTSDHRRPFTRLLALVESGTIEPHAPELRGRLIALRSQKAELDGDIARLQNDMKTRQPEL